MTSGITVQCVACKRKKLLSFEEAAAITDQPTCDNCYLPMVVVQAAFDNRKQKGKPQHDA